MRYCRIIALLFLILCSTVFGADDLGFIFRKGPVYMSMQRFKKNFDLGDSTPFELVDQSNRNILFGYKVREAIFRFNREKKLRSADLTVFATLKDAERPQALTIFNGLTQQLDKNLGKNRQMPSLKLRNKRVIAVYCWESNTNRVILWYSQPHNPVDVTFINLRWELKNDYPEIKKYFSWYAAARPPFELQIKKGSKSVIVPHRRQSDITGKCAPTTVSRQLAQCGSEIPPVILRAFWDDIGEGRFKDLMGRILKFKSKDITFGGDVAGNCIKAIKEYNELAGKMCKPPIKHTQQGKQYGWGDNFINSDPALWKKLKTVDYKRYKEFKRYIIKNIDSNTPVSWTVKRHNSRGRHRRMIIGYDQTKDLVHFSDTWGGSSNMRSMPFRAAYVMTVWCSSITCSN